MLIKHFFVEKIAHSSYILAGKSSCAVIDPQRDVDIYIRNARSMGVDITHILLTHLHADFISGHMDLAKRTGAAIIAPKSANCLFDHHGVSEHDEVELENTVFKVMETPGHTPEHISYVVSDRSRSDSPVGVFVGDTLFVGDVGRPDLFPDMAEELAGRLYHSLHENLLKLPDYVEVFPAHGAGSLCGRAMAAKWQTTIGYERNFNPALQIKDKSEFIRSLTQDMPPAPDHFGRSSDINRKGPALVAELPEMKELGPEQLRERITDPGILVLDTRGYHAFAGQHIHGSWHLDLNGNFPTFSGWVLPTDRDVIMVADDHDRAFEARMWAHRVGLDRIAGYLDGGLISWVLAGFRTDSIQLISAEGLHEFITRSSDFVLLDVRAPLEFADNHIEGAVNIPVADLRTRHAELDHRKPTILICSSGNRSSLAASILKQHGFNNLYNVAGGMSGYSAAGYTRQCRACVNPHGSRFIPGFRDVLKHRD